MYKPEKKLIGVQSYNFGVPAAQKDRVVINVNVKVVVRVTYNT